MSAQLDIPVERIRAFCEKWKVKEFSLFGSVLRDDFRPDSDVDVLVVLREDSNIDLYDWIEMRDELAAIFNREVHLTSKNGLRNPFRRREILDTSEVIYAA
jgi:hypothetical protein